MTMTMAMTMTMMNACIWYSPLLFLVQSFKGVGEGKRDGRSVFSGEIEVEVDSVCQSICRGDMMVEWASWVVDQEVYLLFMGFVFCVWVWGERNGEKETVHGTRSGSAAFSQGFICWEGLGATVDTVSRVAG
jgi:hypothetical protein